MTISQAFGQTVQLSDDAKGVTSELGWCGESFYDFQILYFLGSLIPFSFLRECQRSTF